MHETLKAVKRNKYLNFFTSAKRGRVLASVLAMAVVLIGGYLLVRTSASGFFAGVEPESGSLSGNTQLINDASASGGKAVLFAAPSPTPPPPSPPPAGSRSCPAYDTSLTGSLAANQHFPDASCTGSPTDPTKLPVYTGPTIITTPGTIIDGKNIKSCLTIQAPNVIIRNSALSCRPDGDAIANLDGAYSVAVSPYNAATNSSSNGLLVEDTTIDCQNAGGTAIGDTNFTAIRLNIFNCENGFDVDQYALIQDNFIHDLYVGSSSHTDAIQLSNHCLLDANGNVTIITDSNGTHCKDSPNALNVNILHNSMMVLGNSASVTNVVDAAIISGRVNDTNILIQYNIMAGGGYSLYCVQNGNKGVNYRIFNNQFSTKYFPKVGLYDHSTDCTDETQSGNMYHETGQLISPLD